MNIAFFASYNGSSAQAITDACLAGDIIAAPTLIISNNEKAKALEWAKNKGVKPYCINKKTHPDFTERDIATAQRLQEHKIDIILLCGYMQLIGSETINAVEGKIMNIHPALLPKYGGKGMYGRHVHQAVKESGDTETGITIHQANGAYDEGQILAQKTIPVSLEDTVEDIENKVKSAEPDFYIQTLKKILNGELSFA